jgi:sugar O-acyltransferase (sialic acid O-acetyltransferase NeuD family)
LAILGASGHGKVVADTAIAAGWQSVTFFDDAFPRKETVGPWMIRGSSMELVEQLSTFHGVIVAIGDNGTRLRLQMQLVDAGATMVTIVHPGAWVSTHSKLGFGTVVMAGAVINIGAKLGRANIVNTSATVDHDCQLDDGVHISPGAHLGGGVRVGACSWIGIGSSVRHLIEIGADVVVGAGAVVTKDIAPKEVVVGNPARAISRT